MRRMHSPAHFMGKSFLAWCVFPLAIAPLFAQGRSRPIRSGSSESVTSKFLQTSLCEALADPARFDGKMVKFRAKYSGTSEGTWLSAQDCSEIGELLVPFNNKFGEEMGIANVVRDGGWQDFDSARRRLHNELSNRGDYDYLTADFAGVLVIRRNFRVKNGFGNGWGHLGMNRFRLLLISVSKVSPHHCDCPTSDVPPPVLQFFQ